MTEENSRSWLAEAAGNYTTNMKYKSTFSSFTEEPLEQLSLINLVQVHLACRSHKPWF